MGGIEFSNVEEFPLKNGYLSLEKTSNANTTRDDSTKNHGMKKVFVHRNSILMDMTKVNHFQAKENLFRVVCICLFVSTFFYYKAEPTRMWEDLDNLMWALSTFPSLLKFWLLFNLFGFAFFEGFKLWITVRNRFHSKVVDKAFLFLFTVSYSFTYIITGYYMVNVNFRPIWGFLAGSEQTRIYMKVYSFVRECAPRVMQHTPEEDARKAYALYPTRKHYMYFLFAPVLLYRDHYPRTEKIQWKNVFYNLFHFSLCIFMSYCLLMRLFELFKNVGLRPFKPEEKVLLIAFCTFQGFLSMFLIGYGILHCSLNIIAELLRFGDREFYKDWWNCTTVGQYCRRWNVVVHDWLYTYNYMEFQRLGCSTTVSRILVFLIASVVHEYFLSLSLGFFYPLFGLSDIFGGVVLIPFTRRKTGQIWNLVMWVILILHFQPLLYHYAVEWYARVNCVKQETPLDFFIPRMIDPSCQITAS